MKNFAYTKRQENDFTLYLYDDASIPVEASRISALMMDRLDFDIKIIEIPPVGEEEVANLLHYRLRSIYPGDPGETSFDFKLITKKKKRYAILFITTKKTIEIYRKLAPRKPLYLPYSIVENHLRREQGSHFIYLYWETSWIDIMIFEDKALASTIAIKREKEIFLDFLKLKNILPENYPEYKCIILGHHEEYQDLVDKSGDLFAETGQKEFLELEELFRKFQKSGDSLFRPKSRFRNITNKIRVDVLAAVILFLGCLLFNKYVSSRQAFLNELARSQQDRIEKSITLTRYQRLRNELTQLYTERPLDPYLILSEYSKIMAGDALLYSFQMRNRDSSHTIEGEAFDPNRYNDRFKSSDYFIDTKIDEIVAMPGINKDRFKASGEFNANQ